MRRAIILLSAGMITLSAGTALDTVLEGRALPKSTN